MTTNRIRLAAAAACSLLAACVDPSAASLRQLAIYKSPQTPLARIAGQTGEAIDCPHRTAVCADLWLARAEALLVLAASGASDADLRDAGDAAARAKAAVPDRARPDLTLRAVKVQVSAAQGLRDRAPDTPTAMAADDRIAGLVATMRDIPGGAPYADWFAVEAAVMATLRTMGATEVPCVRLAAFRAGLPSAPVPGDIAAPLARMAANLDDLIRRKGCAP